ncbi:MAG TPA: GNAT family N-acetyltransferase [Enhygromyxa sp.]|nr:GNAT family N-acetyltransferase [Enhygromyxa sp.]
MDVSFRPIVEQDFEAICTLVTSEEELFLVYDRGKYPLTTGQVRRLTENRMEPTVMLHHGRVVGFGCYYSYREAKSAFIGNIVLDRSMRGKGLGKRLVSHLIDRAFGDHDLPLVKLHVYTRNLPALLLYSALGFQPYAMKVLEDYEGDPVLLLSLGLSRDAWLGR